MKNATYLFILSLISISLSLDAQSYNFNVTTGDYTNLSGSTSLNNEATWDDPYYEIPIGFNFEIMGHSSNTIYFSSLGLGGVMTTASILTEPVIPIIIPYDADLIDRGFDFDTDEANFGSQSNLSYLLEGTAGNRILKIEWNNVGFYTETSVGNESTDYVNFQLWLYEGSNDIEYHYGPSSVNQPDLSFDGNSGPIIGLVPKYETNADKIIENAYLLSGDPADPTFNEVTDGYTVEPMQGTVPDGTIYRFSTSPSNINEAQQTSVDVQIKPNPTFDKFHLTNQDGIIVSKVSIYNNLGQLVKSIANPNQTIDVSELVSGIYAVKIATDSGQTTRLLQKQ